jgi:hypothetical protein
MQQVYLECAEFLQHSLKIHTLGSTSSLNWAGYSVVIKVKGNGVFYVHKLFTN